LALFAQFITIKGAGDAVCVADPRTANAVRINYSAYGLQDIRQAIAIAANELLTDRLLGKMEVLERKLDRAYRETGPAKHRLKHSMRRDSFPKNTQRYSGRLCVHADLRLCKGDIRFGHWAFEGFSPRVLPGG
jgi:hypothetical protein